jgi:outer membrane receptor protein involved in Fe transport
VFRRLPLLVLPVLAAVQAAIAAEPQTNPADEVLEEVLVYGIYYRNRSAATAPVLSYDLEYFQRFEPSTVGDMLKRVPSAVFVSDVLEYDGVQLRGLAPAYTQVLVNGKKVPGAGDDRSFWVDRIPAEMVERVEILRSNSANRSGDAMAGAINIVLRDAHEFDGNYVRAGAMHYDDGKVQPTLGGVLSGDVAGGHAVLGAYLQDRYNPKIKRSDRFDAPGASELASFEDQTDTRDGQDYSGTLSYAADVGATGKLKLDGFYVKTDREEVEVSDETEFDDGDIVTAFVPGLKEVDQANWGFGAQYGFDLAGGTLEMEADMARFEDDSTESEESVARVNDVWDEHEAELLAIGSTDTETSLGVSFKHPMGAAILEAGVDYRVKKRDIGNTTYEFSNDEEEGLPVDYNSEFGQFDVVDSSIKETRLDPYLMLSGTAGALAWEAGMRYETTKTDMDYSIAQYEAGELDDEDADSASKDYETLLPSVHFRWSLSDSDRIALSLARTVRRPDFRQITPVTWEEEFEDNDLAGNPNLKPEQANGIDLGYEHRLGQRGVVGVNLFYRDVKDLIEIYNTGDFSDTYEGDLEDFIEEYQADNGGASPSQAEIDDELGSPTYVYSTGNIGDGRVWGVEFDLSAPLAVIGMPDTGLFANYSWLKSEVEDFLGERRFNNQANKVYNFGFIQNLPAWKASFGASYRKQGSALTRVVTEEIVTTYGADLEVFVEKTFGRSLSVRLSGSNLLDARKREYYHVFSSEADQVARAHDEYELEAEHAGPRFQFVLRWAF